MSNNAYQAQVLMLLIVAIIIICICLIVFAVLNRRTQKEIIRMNQYSINTQVAIDNSIRDLLNDIVSECFEDYKIMVLYPLREGYISDERELQIRSDLVMKVTERLSPMALDKLSLRYNLANIGAIIADKIYIAVMDYVVDHNNQLQFNEGVSAESIRNATAAEKKKTNKRS